MAIVQRLAPLLPKEYTAEPRVQLGSYSETDARADRDADSKTLWLGPRKTVADPASSPLAPPKPTLSVDIDLADQYEYEVLIYDQDHGRRLVAALEMVSPANKDRPQNRHAFVMKCDALLRQGVCVSIVDLITVRNFNLYSDLLAQHDRSDPEFRSSPPSVYAVTCRCLRSETSSKLEAWAYRLAIGQPLPSLPIWLSAELSVTLDLDASYEETCRALRIP